MPTLAAAFAPAASRRLTVRARRDLVASRHHYQGRPEWVVKDPLALTYFRFQDEEYALLQMLDGQASLTGMREEFERRFAPQKITLGEIERLVSSLYQSGLVISEAAGQGRELEQRRDERDRRERLAGVTNILSIRLRGFDPDRLLTAMYPFVRWAFSPWAVAAWALLVLSALLLVTVQFDQFHARLPAFNQFFTVTNACWLAVAMATTKVLHEFGHALSAKHFGGECHEMGLMLLVLTPCLYCNVSDSSLLPSKWRRAAIGAAGMYVELAIAACATFLWWFSQPGLLNHLALSTMFVCSASTLIFNSNPLMRYDGYYILADLIEIPNLRQKSVEIVRRWLGQLCLGLKPREDPFLPRRNQALFAAYAVAAGVYRWLVALSILWFLHKVFEPYRLQVIGQALALLSLVTLIGVPLWRAVRFLRAPGRSQEVKHTRLLATLAVAAGVVAGVAFIPLPHRVLATLEVQPRDAQGVYVDVPGTLVRARVQPGDRVRAGQELLVLESIDLDLAIAQLTGERDQERLTLESLDRQRFRDKAVAAQIPERQQSLAALEDQLARKLGHLERLTLTAPIAGTVLPPPSVPRQPPTDGRLPAWSGVPLEARNEGCQLDQGTLVCQIGDPRRWQANLVIDQADIEFVREGQQVELKLDQMPHDTLSGAIMEIARLDLKVSPRQLSNKAGGELATRTDAGGVERPLSASYQAHVPIDDEEGLLRTGLRGQAKIHVGWQTLGQRFVRYLARTFHFRL